MSNEIECYINPPYYDLNEAIENYGLDIDMIKENNFHEFISGLIEDYIQMRKSFIMKDLGTFRKKAHKIKGVAL